MNTIYAERQIIRERSRRDELNIYVFRRAKLARAANKMQERRRAPYTTIKSIKERRGPIFDNVKVSMNVDTYSTARHRSGLSITWKRKSAWSRKIALRRECNNNCLRSIFAPFSWSLFYSVNSFDSLHAWSLIAFI